MTTLSCIKPRRIIPLNIMKKPLSKTHLIHIKIVLAEQERGGGNIQCFSKCLAEKEMFAEIVQRPQGMH